MTNTQREDDQAGDKPGGLDWGTGEYEITAAQLQPAAQAVVDRAALQLDERVLDLGCGTGNAALLAADCGARVTGVDPAARLLSVARERAEQRGARIAFLPGDAATLPLGDAAVDVVLSVFAAIFAPDPAAAAAEMARVTTSSGRIVLSAWLPTGPVREMYLLLGDAVRSVTGEPAPPPPFPWHDHAALTDLFSPYGFRVDLQQHALPFRAPSARAYVDIQSRTHPAAITAVAVLEARGEADALRDEMVAVLENGNEDPDAFQVTSHYVIATAIR